MKVLVTFAVDAEFAPWRDLRRFEKQNRGGTEVYVARIESGEVTVLLTGMLGKKLGWQATSIRAGVDVCISSGLAGGLKAEYQPGDILAARRIERGPGVPAVVCDEALASAAAKLGAKIVECFHSVDHIVQSTREKRELGKAADAVEMESGEILSRAAAAGARIIAIRGISDAWDEDLPIDFGRATTDSGDVSIGKVLSQVVRKPQSIFALIRFGRQSRHAAGKLGKFLDDYVAGLAHAGEVLISKEQ